MPAGLIDLSKFTIEQLRRMAEADNDALSAAIRRATEAAEEQAEKSICAFNSAI